MQKIVDTVNNQEANFDSNTDLIQFTADLRARNDAGESLDQLLPEAFAAVREAAKRTKGMRHFDVQMIGGMVLHDGKIAEMRTGEGKTLTATLAVYLNALSGNGVHVVTVVHIHVDHEGSTQEGVHDMQPAADGQRRVP